MGTEPLALAEAMLALGVKRFKLGELEVEFHDSAVQRSFEKQAPEDKSPEDAYLVELLKQEKKKSDVSAQMDVLFRSVT